ncbi:unnamed protein product [Paramecium octaurelia]|uniref:EGF-like domain-containing protein n=1 Tax=Paramecium octaurelia TaxID=43137 RepID=A0A8S1WPB7_PAROT|nr:unnamed protein product [Paramecium octaurelia]
MIQSSFAIIAYLNCIIQVFGIQETVSDSFSESTFSDADGWVVIGAVSPTQANSMCGNEAVGDACLNSKVTIGHSSSTAIILITSTMTADSVKNQNIFKQFWGIRAITIYVDKCPDGCLLCNATDLAIQCLVWQVFYRSWTQLNVNEISSNGWNVKNGISEATQCGSTALFGGSTKFQIATVVSQSFSNIPKHDKMKISFLLAKIDDWFNYQVQLTVDGTLVWKKVFGSGDGYNWYICGVEQQYKTQFYRVEVELYHERSQLDVSFSSITQKVKVTPQSYGIRDLVIYIRYCPQGTYWTGVIDLICQYCHNSCYKCDGPKSEDCTDCGDPMIYQKQLVAGQCSCLERTVQQDNIDGTTSCFCIQSQLCLLACHPKCERCYKPFDNTVNQYCTMCLQGQNRVVSDLFMCVCRTGYGDDGISEVCFKCHYSCEHCNGFLANNCTTCLSSSNRILTSESQCLCKLGYFDTGTNDVFCKKICHNACSSCTLPGVDQCTSCPVTRQPDIIGANFQCLCKNSHQYSDDTKLECQECHFTCLICYGGQESNCLTCDIAYRQFSMQKCICPNGYYDQGQLICSPCHYKCMTCFGPAENNCLTCANSNNRILKNNICLCPDMYLENQADPMCYKCSYRCSSCSVKTENCTACPLQSYRDLGTDNACSCQTNMYEQPNNPICIPCHYTCLTCNGPESNQCTSCYTQIMRQLDPLGSCLCMNSYYDPGQAGCLACNPRCLNCENFADNCISCKSDRFLQGNTCICPNKINGVLISKYEKPGKVDCLSCHYSCLECNGSEFNQCTKCLDSEGRILINSTCVCASPNVDIGQPQCQCQQCHYRCETCENILTNCLTCAPNTFRTLSISRCICQQGYFDDGSNPICQKCHYSCQYCSSFSTKCDTCSSTFNRVLNPLMFTCNCKESYYDIGNEDCQKCHYSCLACNSFGNEVCESCKDVSISFRFFNKGVCDCLPGYFDDGVSPDCKKCQISCLTCQNTATYCTSCEQTRYFEGNSCLCNTGYFEIDQVLCEKCDQKCQSCSINAKMCTECDSMRILNQVTKTCICKPGTTEIDGQCQDCDITCNTCQNSITDCSSCKFLRLLTDNQCNCIDGTYENSNDKQCLYCNKTCQTCINQENYCTTCSEDNFRILSLGNDGYYEDTVSLDCKPCDSSCLTCNIFPTYCLTCNALYNLSLDASNKCVCSPGFYFNSSNLNCQACYIQCLECKSYSECIECEDFTRYFDPDNFECPCKDGYYEVTAKKCQLCDYSCRTCQTSPTECLSCEPLYHRLLNSNQCICQDGYYDIGIEMCQLCNPICLTCWKSSTQCTSCNQPQQFRLLNLNQCICQSGYYDIGQLVCQKCSNQCLTCQGQQDFCTSCDIYQYRIDQSIINKCPCQQGFYQDINEICQKCHYKCQTCVQKKDNCLSCVQSQTSNRLSISKNCNCKDGYYDNDMQSDCLKCSPQCKLCQNSSKNCLTCYGDLREAPPNCNCKLGYFENLLGICEPCENKCYSCEKTPSNCLSCQEGRITQLCICQDGYYERGQPHCDQCSFQCKTCKDSSVNCLSCKGDRIKIPICSCPEGYYDDYLNDSCQVCNWLCQTCNLDGCLTCKANRILSPEMSCDQPPGSVSYPDTPWCSTCQVAVLKIRLSDDLLSIQVKFDFPLNPHFFTTQFQENICQKILEDQTYQLFGRNPNCYIDPNDATIIILGLGQQPRILPGDLILFQRNYLGHQGCDQPLVIFIFNEIKSPVNPQSPILIYDEPTYLINPCDDNIIPLKSILNDGLRNFVSIKWTYFVIGPNGNGDIDNFIASQTKYQMLSLIIPFQTLPRQSNITFEIEFQNFVAKQGVQSIRIQTNSGRFPTIFWVSKPTYYTFEPIVLEFNIKKRACSDINATQVDNSQFFLSLVEVHKNDSNSRSSRVNYSEITGQNKCSNQCLTCQGQKDFCTSCDVYQYRIDQSIINKCPCQYGFYQDINEICQKCHYKCQTCVQKKDNCLSCVQSQTSNRLSISKNCNCKDGYYDNDMQSDCLKCSPQCKLCQNSSNNCLTCYGDLREAPPNCNCKLGYFESLLGICEPCENKCYSCEKTPSNCLSCQEGRITQLCICQDGYYERGQPHCDQCSFQCKTCKDSSVNCLSCKGDRIKIPICSCPEGYYDDYLNDSCQVCNWLCQTCNLDGCLTCKANRILSPEMSCDQPPGSVSYPDTPWCSTCQVAVLKIRLSDDLLSIQVKFDFPLNPNFFTPQFQENICQKILEDQTYQLFGRNPNCYIDPNDTTIIILGLGQQPRILPGDLILFQRNHLGHKGCDQPLVIFIFNEVKSPVNPQSPILIYDEPTYLINPCDDNIIPLKSKLNDGLRSFVGIKWTYFVIGPNGNGDIDNFIASQTKYQMLELVIPFQTLPKQSNITFVIEFQNFVAKQGVQSIRMQTNSGRFPTIFWVSKLTYYTFEPIVLEFNIKKRACSDINATQVDNSQFFLSLVEVHKNDSNSRSSRVNYSEITGQNSFIVIIDRYTLTPMVAYTFEQTTSDVIVNFSTKRNITIEISSGGIMCQFNGTKKIQNHRKDTQIFISCKDLDTQYNWNQDPDIEIDVECIDFNRNSQCVDIQNKIIQINRTDTFQAIPKYTINPYSIQSWTVVAKKRSRSYKFEQKLVYIDENFGLLNIAHNQWYLMRPVNNYENLEFIINIPFQNRQYLLEFQVAIIYNFELIKILQSEYFQFQFNIFDYYQKFSEGNKINLKFLAQFTNEIIPCQEDLQLTVNLPPSCIVSLSEQIVQALKPLKIITNCHFSINAPFTYQLRYVLHNQHLVDFLDRTNDYSLILSSYSSSYYIESTFPFSDGFLLIQAMDSKGSYSNIQKQLNITQTVLNCSQIQIQQFTLRYQISLLFEIIMNHKEQQYCIDLSKQLYSNIKTFLNAEENDDQLLVYQTAKLYKRIIQEHVNVNSKKRLLTENSVSCFQNSTKSFYVQSTLHNASSTITASSLQAELQYMNATVQKMITMLIDIKDQINQNDVFLNENLYQSKVAVLDSLLGAQLLIEDVFLKIPMAPINSKLDKEQIINIAEGLIGLLDEISLYVNVQAKVNGSPLINDGQIIKWQLSKITKGRFNAEFNIERDQLDDLIDFVQKEQIELNYNYLNLSQQLQTQLQTFFNITTLQINENTQKKIYLSNHLYNNRSLYYQDPLTTYIIDMMQIPYCQEQVPLEKPYQYDCANINMEGQVYKCDFVTEEINNTTVQVSCRCQKLGIIFLIQYPNNSAIQQNSTYDSQENRIENSNVKLDEQPILLFQGIFIVFSFLIYYELLQIEKRSKQLRIESRLETENSIDEALKQGKTQQIIFYPGNFALFKKYFKFIHEVLSCFYMNDPILPKSYRFLQLSIKISIFILFTFLQINLIDIYPIFIILFVNSGIYLLIRLVLKIVQSVYRFSGKCSNSIVIFYLLIHILCYLGVVLQLKECQLDIQIINFEVSLIIIGSLFQFYVIMEPIMIFSRIFLFRHIAMQSRHQTITPLNQLIYFFVQHNTLDQHLNNY